MSAKKTTSSVAKGTNLDKLRQAYDASSSGGPGNVSWWKPNYGDNVVRVLPHPDPDEIFYLETARHRVGEEFFYCLKYHVDPETGRSSRCPICEARTRLYRSGDADLIKIARDIKPRKQYLMNIVDRKDEVPKVYVYGAGVKIWNRMVTTMLDDEIDITNVEEGYDFLVKKEEGPKTEFGQFPTYDNSKARRKASPLHEDAKVAKSILDSRVDLREIPRFEDSEILNTVVNDYIKSLTEGGGSEEFYGESADSSPQPSEKAKANVSDFRKKLAASLRDSGEDEDDEE